MTKKSVIMFDLDGVLFDKAYNLNIIPEYFLARVTALREDGCILVPNSNTPVLRMREISDDYFGFQPDFMVAEKGAVVVIDGQKHLPLHIEGLVEFRRQLMEIFLFRSMIMQGDSVTTMRHFNLFQPNRKLFFADMIREQTLAFYARKTDRHGEAKPDKDWLKEVKEIVDELQLPAGLMPFNYNANYGIAIASAFGCSKTSGYRMIRNSFPDSTFYMIGDSVSAHIDDDTVIHCAVGNASEDYKKSCAFSAKQHHTKGLMEVFDWIHAN